MRTAAADSRVAFNVLGERAVSVDSGEEPLDHPSSRQDLEPDLVSKALNDLDYDRGGLPDPLSAIGTVGEGKLDKGKGFARSLQTFGSQSMSLKPRLM